MKSLSLKKALKIAKQQTAQIPWKSMGAKTAVTVSSPWFIGGSALGLAGIGGYFAYKFMKTRRGKNLKEGISHRLNGMMQGNESCQKIMTKSPRVCLPSDTVSHAAKMMKEQDVGFVPVIDDPQNRHLVGIVTDRDIVLQLASNAADGGDLRNQKLEALMSRDVVACHDFDRLENALTAMAEHQVKRIPVIDKKDRLVGIISQADIAQSVKEPAVTGQVVKEITH